MGSITGIVRNADNTPVPDVSMVIVSGPSHPDMVALTSVYGTFSFDGLRPGSYVLKAYSRDVSDDIPVRVLARQVPYVEIWLDTGPPTSHAASPPDGNVVNEENYFEDAKRGARGK